MWRCSLKRASIREQQAPFFRARAKKHSPFGESSMDPKGRLRLADPRAKEAALPASILLVTWRTRPAI